MHDLLVGGAILLVTAIHLVLAIEAIVTRPVEGKPIARW